MKELEGKFLLLDASNPTIWVGVWENGKWLSLKASSTGALQGLFGLIDSQLKDLQLQLKDLSGAFFCTGPGSTLGIRVASMAIRSWMGLPDCKHWKLFSFESLKVACASLIEKETPFPFAVISEYRNKKWNFLAANDSSLNSEISVVDTTFLKSLQMPILHLPQKKMLDPGASVKTIKYNLHSAGKFFLTSNVLKLVQTPEIFYYENPTYKKWTGERHK